MDNNNSAKNGGGLFGIGGSAVSGNPFASVPAVASNAVEEAGFEMVMSKDEKRKEKKRKREEKLKLVSYRFGFGVVSYSSPLICRSTCQSSCMILGDSRITRLE